MAYTPGNRFISIGGNSTSAGAGYSLLSSGSMFLMGGNNVTLSQNGNSISFNAPAGGGGSVNFSAGTTSGNLASVTFSNSNGVNFGLNGGTITASHNGLTSQSNQNLSFYALGNTTQNSSTLLNASNLSFNGVGDLTVGYSNGSIQLSAGTQSVQTQNMVNLNGSSGALSISGGANITVGNNASTITISGQPMFDAGVSNTAAAGGSTYGTMNTANTMGLAFYAGNNIGLSQSTGVNGNSVTILGAAGGVNIAGGGATYTSGTANFSAAGGAITIASSTAVGAQSLNFSVPAVSSLVGINGVTVSTNGSTISISGQGGAATAFGTVSNWEPILLQHASLSTAATYGQASLYFNKLQPMAYVTASQLQILLSMSVSTTTAGTLSVSHLLSAGIYASTTGSQMTLLSQGVVTYSYALSNGFANSNYTGIKGMTIPLNINMSPGNYWLGMASRLSSSSSSINQSFTTSNIFVTGNVLTSYQGLIGAGPNASQGIQEGVGMYSTTVAGLPTVVSMNQITQSTPRAYPVPYVAFKNMTW